MLPECRVATNSEDTCCIDLWTLVQCNQQVINVEIKEDGDSDDPCNSPREFSTGVLSSPSMTIMDSLLSKRY